MNINDKIKKARRQQLLTQQEVANRAGVDIASVCRVEQGGGSELTILKICKALGIKYGK